MLTPEIQEQVDQLATQVQAKAQADLEAQKAQAQKEAQEAILAALKSRLNLA